MVTIIKEVNKDLDKNMFLQNLVNKEVNLRIVRVSEPLQSRRKNEEFIYIDFEVLSDFEGYFTQNKKQTDNIKGEIISIGFTLSEVNENNEYKISKGKNIYNILNYALKIKHMIPVNNNSSFFIAYDEIYKALNGLEFKATSTEVESRDFNNYYRLEIYEKGDNTWD